jgi:hypothetical protein
MSRLSQSSSCSVASSRLARSISSTNCSSSAIFLASAAAGASRSAITRTPSCTTIRLPIAATCCTPGMVALPSDLPSSPKSSSWSAVVMATCVCRVRHRRVDGTSMRDEARYRLERGTSREQLRVLHASPGDGAVPAELRTVAFGIAYHYSLQRQYLDPHRSARLSRWSRRSLRRAEC